MPFKTFFYDLKNTATKLTADLFWVVDVLVLHGFHKT